MPPQGYVTSCRQALTVSMYNASETLPVAVPILPDRAGPHEAAIYIHRSARVQNSENTGNCRYSSQELLRGGHGSYRRLSHREHVIAIRSELN